jgi:hypothetical protein
MQKLPSILSNRITVCDDNQMAAKDLLQAYIGKMWQTADACLRLYIGLPSITVVPVGDFVPTVLVSSKPAAR